MGLEKLVSKNIRAVNRSESNSPIEEGLGLQMWGTEVMPLGQRNGMTLPHTEKLPRIEWLYKQLLLEFCYALLVDSVR